VGGGRIEGIRGVMARYVDERQWLKGGVAYVGIEEIP